MNNSGLSFFAIAVSVTLLSAMACSPTPSTIKLDKENYILEGADSKEKIVVTVADKSGNPITEGIDIVFFSDDTSIIDLNQEGEIKAVTSGEAKVDIEVVGTDLKITAPVRVKIPASIEVSHEKLRLWTGQVKDNVSSWVNSEKGAFIEGFLPEWSSEDPSVVSVERIPDPLGDPKKARSYVRLVGKKSGDTYIISSFRNLSQPIRVRVYDEDEEVALDGTRKSKTEEPKEEEEKK